MLAYFQECVFSVLPKKLKESGFINKKVSEHLSQPAERQESNILVCKCILQFNKQYCNLLYTNLISKGQICRLPVYIALLTGIL